MSKSTLKPTDEDRASMWKKRTASERGIFDEHASGVAGDDRCGLRLHVVGEQDGGLVMAEIGDEELTEGALLGAHLLLIDPRGAVLAVGHVERDGAPSRRRQLVDLGQ